MIHGYPFTDYHELSLDFIMKLARESLGLHLETAGKFLKLVNANGDDISKLLVTYADMARVDDEGNTISAFILNAGVDGNAVIFTKGNGEVTTITVPYSVKAEKDMNNNAITSYVHGVNVNGDNLIVTFGDGSTLTVTVPYAIKARDDVNGKALTSYVASVVPVGDKLAIKDGNNNTIAEITVPYAVKASNDEDNDNIKTTYGHSLATGTTTVKLLDKSGTMLNEIVVPYSISALEDTDGNAFLSDYGYHLGTNGRKTTIESHTGTTLNEITVPFATLSSDSENAIESVTISGDTIVFTTYSGQNFTITAPYAVKALKDSLNNTFISSYISNVTADNATGKISFFAPDGTKLAEITPTVNKAVNDSFNNRIADYVKTIVTNPNSDYMTVTHGTGETDSITIHYATRAYKDTYDNVIGNTYIRSLSIEYDAVEDKYYLVAYNGELSELFRIDLVEFTPELSLEDLTDVTITSPTSGDVLKFGNTQWENGPLALHDLSDVTEVLPIPQGAFLVYDSLNHWVASVEGINSMSDVDAPSPSNGDILIYDSINHKWVNSPIPTPTVPDKLNDLNDVDILNPVSGDILIYDSVDDVWYNKDLLMQNIANTDINTPTDGDILIYDSNSSTWNNTNLLDLKPFISMGEYYMSTQSTSLNSLSDILNPNFGDTLYLTIYDTNGVERRVPCCAYLAETENNGTWSRALFVNAVSWTNNGTADRMRAYIYFNTGNSIYKLSITADHGDNNFTVVSMATVTDIFS
ncbi:MAG: hypothetical protein J6S67_02805 [Methanobrevibacter sp.]|nr:hypothetical protein [Methanobrevibacter sp.]